MKFFKSTIGFLLLTIAYTSCARPKDTDPHKHAEYLIFLKRLANAGADEALTLQAKKSVKESTNSLSVFSNLEYNKMTYTERFMAEANVRCFPKDYMSLIHATYFRLNH